METLVTLPAREINRSEVIIVNLTKPLMGAIRRNIFKIAGDDTRRRSLDTAGTLIAIIREIAESDRAPRIISDSWKSGRSAGAVLCAETVALITAKRMNVGSLNEAAIS